jgi:hypothetical protein
MPQLPATADQLWAREISFVSIDTDLIQAAGYKFSSGALNQLPRQLPKSMNLQLSAVVVEEVVTHRMRPVEEAVEKLEAAKATLDRLVGLEPKQTLETAADILSRAQTKFREEIRDYALQCRGNVIPIAGENAASDLFESYFENSPPFEARGDKKHEFPDAMSLWLLEEFAKSNKTKGLVASKDKGWKLYAAKSENLYYVESIDALTELFVATDGIAKAIQQQILEAVRDETSPLREKLRDELDAHLEESDWDASDVYSGNVHWVQAYAGEPELLATSIVGEPKIWSVDEEPTSWIVELSMTLSVNVNVNVEFFIWDSIDREEISMGSQAYDRKQTIEIEVFLTCDGVSPNTSANDWTISMDIANESYLVDAFEAELDYGGDE